MAEPAVFDVAHSLFHSLAKFPEFHPVGLLSCMSMAADDFIPQIDIASNLFKIGLDGGLEGCLGFVGLICDIFNDLIPVGEGHVLDAQSKIMELC